jgi:hypothetical protein
MNLRKKAEGVLARETDDYVKEALEKPEAPVDEARLKRIAALRDTVKILPRSSTSDRVIAASLVALNVAILLAVWLKHIPAVEFAADITARQAAVRNAANVLAGTTIRGKSVHFENGASILGLGLPDAGAGEPRDITGDTVWLQNLQTKGAGMTEIKPTPGGLDITVSDGVIRGTLLKRPDPTAAFDSADFEATATAGRPAIVHIESPAVDPIDIGGNAQPTDFLLTEQSSIENDAQLFRSAVIGGTITIPVGSRKLTLHPGDITLMRGIRVRWLQLAVDKTIHLSVEGTGAVVQTGPQNAIEDLRPTVLESVMENKSGKLLWGGFLFISGLIWKLWKFFTGGSEP